MDKRTFVGLCAALAFAVGSPGAYALKIFDTPQSVAQRVMGAETNGSFTYAAETLLMGTANVTEASDDSDTATYYNIVDDVHLAAPVGIAATEGDIYVVTFTLAGMVFQDAVVAADLSGGIGGGTFSLATGGASGDKLVVFRLTDEEVATTVALNLAANFAISGNAGTVTMTITNQTLAGLGIPGVSGREVHTGTVIKVAPALDEDAMAMNATADVAASFKKFLGGMSVASVGSLEVGFETHRSAGSGSPISALTEIILTALDDSDPQSTVTFMGDFSFANKVYTHGDADCGLEGETTGQSGAPDMDLAPATGLLIRNDDMEVSDTTMTMAVNVTEFTTAAQHLCIMVQGEDDTSEDGMDAPRISATGAYTAMGSYTGIADAAIGPMPQEQTLGMITRNGTTVHIPYMTTYEGYNQRLVLSNRGSGDAAYEIEFRPEEGTTATPMEMATGTLMGNTTVTMKATDLVMLEDGSRTAATIILEAQRANIDVTSVIVNKASQDTDTVVHHSGMPGM